MPIEVNVHPDSHHAEGEHSKIPHPPKEDHPSQNDQKPIPYTGWDDPVPSKDGGDKEEDWMNKPPYRWTSKEFVMKYRSECWCGDVAFEFHGDPLDAKHCHCRQCQRLHGAPFQWAVIFPKTSVRLVKNDHNALHCFSTEKRIGEHYVPCKVSCDTCRSSLFDEGRNTVLVYPSSIRFKDNKVPLDFQPTCHIFYSQRVMEIPDGIPKWSGHKGSSELMQELTDQEGTLPKYKGTTEENADDQSNKRPRQE